MLDRLAAHDHQIGAQELIRLAPERLLHAIGEEADSGHARHCNDQRRGDERKLTGALVTPQEAKRERKLAARRGEPRVQRALPAAASSTLTSLPLARRRTRSHLFDKPSSCVTRRSVVPRSRFNPNMRSMI